MVDHDDIIYPGTIPFVLAHLACFAALWTGVTAGALAICVGLYLIRMFGVTAGYHRYFSHRTFRTGRVGQFLLASLAQSSAQRGVLWWAAKHRHHHRHSDTELDVHSPRQHGFWYSHVGWIFTRRHNDTDRDAVADLTKYPELRWLDRHQYLPAAVLAAAAWLVAGWPGLVVGFFWSTVLLYHGTFMINSLAHVHGTQRYITGDDSRNNWWLAVVTLGEGWHNNHHAYQRATRQGFRWWEYDPTWYALKVLAVLHVVRDLKRPPSRLLDQARVRDGAFDIGMFRSYWERAARVTGERIADLSARPVAPSPEVSDTAAAAGPTAASEPGVPPGSDEQLSTLTGLITRALESADQLAASTRRRKGTRAAPADADAATPE